MQTKLSRICEAIIEAGWLAALIVTPLFFNTSSSRVFEPDKLHLLRSIALVMAVAWIVQLLDTGLSGWIRERGGGFWSAIRRTPLVLPTLALVAAYILSTALSLVPRISFLGSYVRMQGTYTFISYVLIFFMVLTHLRTRAQINRIFYAIILSSLPISIYGIIQHYGLDPLPWGGDVRERVAANMGNAIFVAAYLIIALFLTLERLVDSIASLLNEEKGTTADALRAGAYFFVLAVQLIAIYFTQSRGPWGGLAAGAYVFVMLGLLLVTRWATGRAAAAEGAGVADAQCAGDLVGADRPDPRRPHHPRRDECAPGAAQSGVRTALRRPPVHAVQPHRRHQRGARADLGRGRRHDVEAPRPAPGSERHARHLERHPTAGRLRPRIDVGGLQQLLSAGFGPLRGAQRLAGSLAQRDLRRDRAHGPHRFRHPVVAVYQHLLLRPALAGVDGGTQAAQHVPRLPGCRRVPGRRDPGDRRRQPAPGRHRPARRPDLRPDRLRDRRSAADADRRPRHIRGGCGRGERHRRRRPPATAAPDALRRHCGALL